MIYKIGLISTHGTGKTSLARSIAARLGSKSIKTKQLPELATEASDLGIPINEDTTLEAQGWILHQQCSMELKAVINEYQVIVCDRTVLDNYAYLANAFGENEYYLNLALGHMKQHPYSRFYLLPLVGELKEDGVRDAKNPKFQRAIAENLEALLKKNNISYEALALPEPWDEDRSGWAKRIVYQTLTDLGLNNHQVK